MTRSLLKPWRVWLVMGLLVLSTVPGVFAQTPPDKRFDDLEKQIQSLRQTVAELRRDLKPAEAARPRSDNAAGAKAISRQKAAAAPANIPANDAIARIRKEGFKHSQVMQTLSYLTDVIGPRLTGSPELKRANKWTSDKLASWGLSNPHLEAWGPFGRGWSLKRFSAQIVEPQAIPLIAYPNAWSPGLGQPVVANVVHFDAKSEADLEKYKGKLRGAIVLAGWSRKIVPHFEPEGLAMEGGRSAAAGQRGRFRAQRGLGQAPTPGGTPGGLRAWIARARLLGSAPWLSPQRMLSFLTAEGAAVVVSPSPAGDDGTIFVADASVPDAPRPNAKDKKSSLAGSLWAALVSGKALPPAQARMDAPLRAWSKNAPAMPAQIALATENYGRLVRMIEQGEKLKMAVELQVKFYEDDPMAYNTIAEIPGSDLKDQIVMLGAHMDSWHAGTGATDNAAGVAAAMEAVRIITALKLRPRRTIRIGLWSGEEEGLLGSEAYVKRHFGEYADPNSADGKGPSKAAVTASSKNGGKNQPATASSRHRAGSSANRSMRSSPFTSTSTTAPARSAASTCRATKRSGPSSAIGWNRSETWARIPSRWPTPAAPITSRSMPSVCRPSSSSRTRSITLAARITPVPTSTSTFWPTT